MTLEPEALGDATDDTDANAAKQTAVTDLRNRLRVAIVTGQIPASASRTQAELARALNVSRTPLREALRMLEGEHLIIREPNKRFRAADLSLDELEQLTVLRVTLESVAVRLTVPELTNADYAALEGAYAEASRLAKVGDWDDFDGAHRRFHAFLTRCVGSMHRQQLDRLWEQAARYRRAFESVADADGRDGVSQHEHRAILDAAEAADAYAAAALVAEHHARAAREIGNRLIADEAMERLAAAVDLASIGETQR